MAGRFGGGSIPFSSSSLPLRGIELGTGVHSQVIRFTMDHMVARDMITIDRLVSVYQGDANVVADENPARAPVKNSRREGFSSKSSQKNERGAMPILAF